jgi:alpha-glucuronidase
MKALAAFLLLSVAVRAETGEEAWLRYRPQPSSKRHTAVIQLDKGPEADSARKEVSRALGFSESIALGTIEEFKRAYPEITLPTDLRDDGYCLKTTKAKGKNLFVIASPSSRGVLYGAFAFVRHLVQGDQPVGLNESSNPAAPVRWVNQWDNLDGTIERGYGGRSIFFENDNVVADLTRASEYARLLASVGINGCTVNNVNANPRALTPEFLPQIARIADVFRPWGVKLSLSVDFASPKTIGGLDTFDPLDARVIAWWSAKTDDIYHLIPDFAGFVLKADSEGRVTAVLNRTGLHDAVLKRKVLGERKRDFWGKVSCFRRLACPKSSKGESKLRGFGDDGGRAEGVVEPGRQVAISQQIQAQHGSQVGERPLGFGQMV